MKVAIQGLDASFHALAARQLFGDDTKLVCCTTFKEVFETLKNDRANQAVVAIENSLYGSINEVYDLLLKHDFLITGEAYEHIGLHLLGLENARVEDITDIYSQAPALGEAEAFLDSRLPHAERHEHQDTALAAKEVADWGDLKKAAIASRAAGEKYGLKVVAENIETHHENYTRFIALSKNDTGSNTIDGNKTSIVFQTADQPGALYDALGIFAHAGANLTKLESRPIVGAAWQYMYYVDFIYPEDASTLLEKLTEHASNIRSLGTYASGTMQSV